jgi:D-alanine transaminase
MDMLAFFNGKYIAQDKICISPDDRGFLFSDGLYEVIRSYDGSLFKAREHLERLSRGARILRFNQNDFFYLHDVARNLIEKNRLITGDAIVYMQVTRGSAKRTHRFPPDQVTVTVYASASEFFPQHEELQKGIKIILVPDQRWSRCDIKSISLLANILAHQQARDVSAPEAVFVRNGALQEGSHSNVFAVKDGIAITPPLTNHLLAGITRMVVLELCKELNIPSIQRTIFQDELSNMDELMIVGTTVEITPVIQIDNTQIGNGKPGPITGALQGAFRKLIQK